MRLFVSILSISILSNLLHFTCVLYIYIFLLEGWISLFLCYGIFCMRVKCFAHHFSEWLTEANKLPLTILMSLQIKFCLTSLNLYKTVNIMFLIAYKRQASCWMTKVFIEPVLSSQKHVAPGVYIISCFSSTGKKFRNHKSIWLHIRWGWKAPVSLLIIYFFLLSEFCF